ncbi:hypothetical protein ABZW03_14610 [Kitasatospora sp. NPDC004799]|uniref:hypothetical protein n=1 Tax=Kitasatospora sp. NPDC004799 TaxID=3154460 RepID=UPI00339FECCA
MDARSKVAGGDGLRDTAELRDRPRRERGFRRAARLLVRVLLVLTGLATVALGFARYVDTYDEAVAYRDAPSCTALGTAPATDCNIHETGRVTSKKARWDGESYSYEVTLSRETVPAHLYGVTEGLFNSVADGADVDVTVWNGRVVELSHRGHRSPVAYPPWDTAVELALLIGAGSALLVFGLLSGHRDGWIVPAAACLFLAFTTFIGGPVLIINQFSFGLTLALPLIGWLLITAAATAVSWEY